MNLITTALSAIFCLTFAFTSFAQTRDRQMVVKVGTTTEDVAAKREVNLHAVLIGISKYKFGDQNIDGNQISNLKSPSDDATEIYKFLKSPEGGSFPDANITLLTDDQATKSGVEAALNRLKQTKPEDYFVIFIAAHGVIWQEKSASGKTEEYPYFVLYDTDPRDISKTAMRMEFFKKTVQAVPARKGLVMSDTCHSAGVMLDSGSRGLAVTQRAQNQLLATLQDIPRGVGYLSAADQNESSLEKDELGHGVFTYCLLEAVRGNADADAVGKVTFEELKNYVRDEVPKLTDNKQHPQYATSMLSANQIPLSVVTYPELGKCSGATPCGILKISNPEVDGVTVSIDGIAFGSLNSGGQRTIRVPAGSRRLVLSKGSVNQTQQANVEANKTTSYEINAAFSSSEQVVIIDPPKQQNVINLDDEAKPKKEAESVFQNGVDQFNKQRFQDAIDSFNKAIAANGGAYHQAYVYRGRAEQSLGRKQEAIRSFDEAVKLRPTDYQTKTLLAEARFNGGGNTESVVKDLREITRRYPRYDYAWVVLGDVLFSRGERAEAERSLRKALAINPKFPPAHMILANILMYKNPQAKLIENGAAKDAQTLAEAVSHAEQAYDLFNKVADKMRSIKSGTTYKKTAQFFSINYLLFGGARYADEAALAETHYILGKAYTRLVGFDDGKMTDAERDKNLRLAEPHIQEALKLARPMPEKLRLVVTLATSADHAFLKGDSARAKKEATEALKMADAMSNAELTEVKFDLHLNLYQSHDTDQEYAKAADHLKTGLALVSSRLDPDELMRFKDMLRDCEEKARANKKRK